MYFSNAANGFLGGGWRSGFESRVFSRAPDLRSGSTPGRHFHDKRCHEWLPAPCGLTRRCCAGAIAKEAALLAPLAGRIYDHAPQQNAFPLTRQQASRPPHDASPGAQILRRTVCPVPSRYLQGIGMLEGACSRCTRLRV